MNTVESNSYGWNIDTDFSSERPLYEGIKTNENTDIVQLAYFMAFKLMDIAINHGIMIKVYMPDVLKELKRRIDNDYPGFNGDTQERDKLAWSCARSVGYVAYNYCNQYAKRNNRRVCPRLDALQQLLYKVCPE